MITELCYQQPNDVKNENALKVVTCSAVILFPIDFFLPSMRNCVSNLMLLPVHTQVLNKLFNNIFALSELRNKGKIITSKIQFNPKTTIWHTVHQHPTPNRIHQHTKKKRKGKFKMERTRVDIKATISINRANNKSLYQQKKICNQQLKQTLQCQ